MDSKQFINDEVLKIDNRLFCARIIGYSVSYFLISWWLNSIRTTASLWIVWPLIIIQFVLYFSIFYTSYSRSKVFGLNKTLALIIFVVLTVVGRVNDWEVLVIPLLAVVMIILSSRNKKVSKEWLSTQSEK